MELWEFNAYMVGFAEARKSQTATAILTGYYAAYYTNGGRKTKNPNELIKRLYTRKQSLEDGLRDIEALKQAEKQKE